MLSVIQTNETLGYSQAVRVGDVLHVSGQVAVDERGEVVGRGDIRAHVEQVFKNLRAVIEAGGSGLDLVAKLTVFSTSPDYLPAIREVRSQVFGPIHHYPASTFLIVSGLARPEYLVEIEAVCAVKKAKA
jgi:enamine deaminase RidA (YjgF/YER057c/UK114 family)